MDVVKGLREARRRAQAATSGRRRVEPQAVQGADTAREARSYDKDWPTADAVFGDLVAGRYARPRRLIKVVYPRPQEPDNVSEQIVNSREIEARDDAERTKILKQSHENNRLNLRDLKRKLETPDAQLDPAEVADIRVARRNVQRRAIRTIEEQITKLTEKRNGRIMAVDKDTSTPPKDKGLTKRAIAEDYSGRIRRLEEQLFAEYERALGIARYRKFFEYIEGENESDIVKFIYTIDGNGVMRMVQEELRPGAERPTHSELARGRNVYAAGQIWVHGGSETGPDGRSRVKVAVVDDGSGHYRPDTFETLPYVRAVLAKYGYDVSKAQYKHAPLPVVPLNDAFDVEITPWFPANGVR